MRNHKRQLAKTLKLEQTQAHIDAVANMIVGDVPLQDIKRQYKPTILRKAFSQFSVDNYPLLNRAFGEAASGAKVLIDECVDPMVLEAAHTHIGITHLSSLVFGKSVKDPELLVLARDHGYGCILTKDRVPTGRKSLHGLARIMSKAGEIVPEIVALPDCAQRSMHVIREKAPEIRALIQA
ncbi:MAG: hypothetical protein CMH25_01660 [Micavibrio sp.]|nr:hypothetical protein [Micavibrio sp.]|tara:strand:- start:325796 stop:326338 length:543 start_codon:yes stop_codon:yes gene_type:complete